MSQTCETCKAYCPVDFGNDRYLNMAGTPYTGECRLSPTPVLKSADSWCLQRKPKEVEARPKRGKRPISEDDRPTEAHKLLAEQLNINLGAEWGKFKNNCLAHDKRYANFESAFRNWLANPNYQKAKR